MLRTIVIDDEKLSREVICNYLKTYGNDIEIVATASSVKTAYKAIIKHQPDFIFLDVEMADGKGFDLLMMFEKIDFKVIFVTAYSEYAVKAFRFSAVDYLLKPVKIDELISAVEKIKSLNGQAPGIEALSELMKNLNKESALPRTLVIPHLKGFDVLKISEIIMCLADGYCTIFFATGNRKYTSSRNLKHFDEMLEELNIIRVHHSYLVNLNHVVGYSRQGEILLAEGHKAYLGDSYKNHFIKRFGGK
ncbi:MAG: LytTR family DNA-binding domain-containing protein [Bacteroidia bacterium]|nr:LytTR family DNA-binding domain-containing protein [Bacteroidia bacterium]